MCTRKNPGAPSPEYLVDWSIRGGRRIGPGMPEVGPAEVGCSEPATQPQLGKAATNPSSWETWRLWGAGSGLVDQQRPLVAWGWMADSWGPAHSPTPSIHSPAPPPENLRERLWFS